MKQPIPLDQYVPVRLTWNPERMKWDKCPVDGRGIITSAHDPKNWMSFDGACDVADRLTAGSGDPAVRFSCGIFISKFDPYWCLDADGVISSEGEWNQLATNLRAVFQGHAIEYSYNGTGLHIFGTGALPPHSKRCKDLPLEFYSEGQLITLGQGFFEGSVEHPTNPMTQAAISGWFPEGGGTVDQEWTTTHVENHTLIEDDLMLVDKASQSFTEEERNGTKASFQQMWENQVDTLAEFYPPDEGSGKPYDASMIDDRFAQKLAFWTGGNCERIERIMRQSRLKRDKWDQHKTYLRDTILRAVGLCKSFYNKPESTPIDTQGTTSTERADSFCSFMDQPAHFNGCIYIANQHKIMLPNGLMLKPEAFNAHFGGYTYEVAEAKTTKKAFEAFTENQRIVFPKVHRECFRPDKDYQEIVDVTGVKEVNTYLPYNAPMNNASAEPFHQHLKNLLPVERDRTILISWMASIVRYKGHKFYWAPLIQGCQGNGKSFISHVMRYLLGDDYVHSPNASELSSKFNGWIRRKLLGVVEDVYVQHGKMEIMETIKPLITERRIEIQAKGMDQVTERNCMNFLFNSNHKDALIKSKDDRRFAIFYTAQQSSDDLVYQGMGAKYFTELYAWLRGDGVGAIHKYLSEFEIPDEFDPTKGATRAPETSSTQEAISVSLGPIASQIQDAIDDGRVGFCGGWISSAKVKELGIKVSTQKLTHIMKEMGYLSPTGLGKNGRPNNPTMADFVKSRLYLIVGHHLHNNDYNNATLSLEYDRAQSPKST